MLYQNYQERTIDYQNGFFKNINVYDKFYYDSKTVLKCSKCNNLIFYVENKINHRCPTDDDKIIEINEALIKSNSNKLKCDVNKIDNIICVQHKKEFLYYKDSNYYCSLCIREKNIKDYLNLDLITLSNNEIDDFKKKIKDSEIIMTKIKEINEK